LTKQKDFSEKPKIRSTGNKLTGWLNNPDKAIDVDEEERAPRILQEQDHDDDDVVELKDVPEALAGGKRKAKGGSDEQNEDEDGLFVSSSDEDFFQTQRARSPKRQKRGSKKSGAEVVEEENRDTGGDDDKKKLGMNTSYDGFSIYGRILCLVVKRKGKKAVVSAAGSAPLGGSQMMEQWVSTQAAQEAGLDDFEDG
jgi:hypothetical protein